MNILDQSNSIGEQFALLIFYDVFLESFEVVGLEITICLCLTLPNINLSELSKKSLLGFMRVEVATIVSCANFSFIGYVSVRFQEATLSGTSLKRG